MIRFFAGVIVGIVLATIGVQGVATILTKSAPVIDSSVNTVKQMAKDNVPSGK